MSRNFWSRSSIVLVFAGVLVSPVLAQERSRPGGPAPVPPVMEELDRMTEQERGPAGRGPADMEEGARHFQAKKRERLMQALQLDGATRNRLSQRLEQLDQRAEDLRRPRRARQGITPPCGRRWNESMRWKKPWPACGRSVCKQCAICLRRNSR